MQAPHHPVARLLLAAPLLLPSFSKLSQLNESIWILRNVAVPYAEVIAPGLAIAELVLGACIAAGRQWRLSLPALVPFTLLNVTLYRGLLLQDPVYLQAKYALISWITGFGDAARSLVSSAIP